MNKPYCESNDNFKQTETKKNNKDIPIPKPQKENKSQIEALEVSSGENITMPSHHRNIIFVMFLLSNLFLNYDTGVIPASLLEIVKEINLDYKEQALLGSLVYLGLSFASLFVSLIFSKFGPSKVCSFVLIFNTCCCFTFSLTSYKPLLFTTRFFMGVTEAFIVIYGPVWVNNYSPVEHSAKWMGILHSCSVLGVVLGYIVAGITINFLQRWLTWRFALQLQGFVQIFFSLFFYFEKDEYINVDLSKQQLGEESQEGDESNSNSMREPSRNKSNSINRQPSQRKGQPSSLSFRNNDKSKIKCDSRIDTIETSNIGRYCFQTKLVLTTPLYITITLGLCSIYFIVTGIQFWMTAYMIGILGIDPFTVVLLFSITTVTAPLFGVLMGGIFADKYGGYKGKNSVKAMKLCCAFGFVSFVFAFPLGFLFSIIYVITLLWFFLFFGAAIIPVGTGIMISSVRKDCQATSSSLSQLIFNFFGYFFSPILTGYIMDKFQDKKVGFIWGMRVVFWWVIFALIFMLSAFILVYKKYKKRDHEEKDLMEEEEMQENMAEFMKLEIRRRLAQSSV